MPVSESGFRDDPGAVENGEAGQNRDADAAGAGTSAEATSAERVDAERARRLLDVGKALVSDLDLEAVLGRILDEARALTGARYAALGVLDRQRRELERFLASGVDEEARRAIGDPPRGRGVLGVLIHDQRPLRLADVGAHPESYGFPPGHPAMRSFLGVPVVVRGQAWGNLYLTEKRGGTVFTQEDEQAVVTLAQWAAIAIENARIHDASERRRHELERAVRSLEATRDVMYAVGGTAELEKVFELIVKRGRSLVGAHTLLIMLRDGDDLVVEACAGLGGAQGSRLPIAGSTAGRVLEEGIAQRVTDVADLLRQPEQLGVGGAHTALYAPMLYRGERIGILAAFDHGARAGEFGAEDEQMLRAFAQSAANTVGIGRSVEADRLRAAIAAADAERARWARELHDETLQALGGLRVLLASTVVHGDAASKDEAMRQAIEDIETEIANLREIIADLRPSLLDDLGLLPALEALLDRRRDSALEIESDLAAAHPDRGVALSRELETTVYRLVQEALTNVVKHARAKRVRVALRHEREEVVVEVQDDGSGFDVSLRAEGFGLAGMRERVDLAGGTLTVRSGQQGTLVSARLPVIVGDAGETVSGAKRLAG